MCLQKICGLSDATQETWEYIKPKQPWKEDDLLNLQELQRIELYSLSGQLIYSTIYDAPIIQIDLSSLQNGVYLIIVKSRDFIKTEKIIKLWIFQLYFNPTSLKDP